MLVQHGVQPRCNTELGLVATEWPLSSWRRPDAVPSVCLPDAHLDRGSNPMPRSWYRQKLLHPHPHIFGTIWVYRREHSSLAHNLKYTFGPRFEASRIHPNSLPAKMETFLRVALRARVEQISSGQLASQVPPLLYCCAGHWSASLSAGPVAVAVGLQPLLLLVMLQPCTLPLPLAWLTSSSAHHTSGGYFSSLNWPSLPSP